MDRLRTRELAYFVAVAEELHFGRAAARLGIAQPPLSRAIAGLERRVGATLLRRTSRSVSLTPAGEVLLHEAGKTLQAADAALRRARRAGSEEPSLPLAMKTGGDAGLLPEILRAYEDDPAAAPVQVLVCGTGEQALHLRDGRADVAFLHLPYDDVRGFDTVRLQEEPQVVVLPRQHRFAGRAYVSLDELHDEPFPRWPGMIPGEASGPEVHDSGQLLQLIALGRTVAVLPASVCRLLRSDLVAVPVQDAPSTIVVVAWPEQSRSLAVAAFVRAATAVARRHDSDRVARERTASNPLRPSVARIADTDP